MPIDPDDKTRNQPPEEVGPKSVVAGMVGRSVESTRAKYKQSSRRHFNVDENVTVLLRMSSVKRSGEIKAEETTVTHTEESEKREYNIVLKCNGFYVMPKYYINSVFHLNKLGEKIFEHQKKKVNHCNT